ncbi:MAG TPA: hypothetical protein VMW09_07275 [Desulfatiglandales bacterium]|nr:hypothetical protein [Desulfatiglandales bacterium]
MYKLDEKQFPLEMRLKATERTFNKYIGTYNVASMKHWAMRE